MLHPLKRRGVKCKLVQFSVPMLLATQAPHIGADVLCMAAFSEHENPGDLHFIVLFRQEENWRNFYLVFLVVWGPNPHRQAGKVLLRQH
jgi:hypothetical protein